MGLYLSLVLEEKIKGIKYLPLALVLFIFADVFEKVVPDEGFRPPFEIHDDK